MYIVGLPIDRLTRQAFEFDFQNMSNSNWCGEMENVFELLNMPDVFANKRPVDINSAKSIFEEQMLQDFLEALPNKPKLRTYKTFKNDICTETFVLKILNKQEHSLVAQLRSGTLPLNIETGRYINLPVDERTCLLCNDNSIENELHFVCDCESYFDLRQNLLTSLNIPNNLPSNIMFKTIKESENPKFLSKFVLLSWNRRKSLLYN